MPGDLHASLADSSTTPYWLDSPDRPAPRPGLGADAVADLCIVGGGYSGLWTAILAKERDPGRDVMLLEGSRIGWAASGRNGGFCAASITHGHANGADRWPDEIDTLDRLGRDNLDGIEATLDALRHRLRVRAAGRDHGRHRAAPPRVAARDDRAEPRRDVPRPGRPAGRGELADLPRRCPRAARHGPGRSREARLGSRRGRRVARRTHPRGHPCRGHRARGIGPRRPHRRGLRRACRPGRPRHQRVPLPGPPGAAAHGPGLRLRADDRAALARAARRGRLAPEAGARRHDQPVPLLPDDPRRPDPLGRLRRDLPLRPARPPGRTTSGPRRSTCWPGSSSPRSRSWRACASPTAGAGRSTPAPASAPSSAPRTPGARRTPSATPGSVSAPPASGPT